jgi:hypothetical protein
VFGPAWSRKEKQLADYEWIDAELFFDQRRGSMRVRPLPGQKYPSDMVIECDKSFRDANPAGSKFRLMVKEKKKKTPDCRTHLYSRYDWGATPII